MTRLVAQGFTPVVVTNQSGIARGLYDEAGLARIHEALQQHLRGQIRAFLHCPHHPEMAGPYGRACACRKPGPGLLDQAGGLFEVDWARSCLIGDAARDLLMGRDRPMTRILLRSGKPWQEQLQALKDADLSPHAVCDDLPAAAAWLEGRRPD